MKHTKKVMKKHINFKKLGLLLAGSALSLSCLSAVRAQDAGIPATANIAVPRLDYKETKLANGLKVVTLEDHRAPVVTLQIWYHVGSKDEAEGKAGFAHMFEHLMFKGSEHVGSEEHARYVEQIGGDYNANTFFDRTLFYETVPSNALDRVLFLEADRMRALRVDEANMKSERAVVEEEHRMDVENAPYGTLFETIGGVLYPKGHPYAHTTIGIMSNLDSAVLKDVQAFHDEYYKPDNATLVLVGDFKTEDARARITKYFANIPHSAKPFTRYPVVPTVQTAEIHKTLYDKLAPLPMVVMAYRLPATEGPEARDLPVFEVMSRILSVGQSSRLYRALVRDQQLANDVGGSPLELKLGGLFFFDAVANAGKSHEEVEKALAEQVELLRTQPVTQAELDKAKNQAIAAKVLGTISTEQKANQLGEADLMYGTPEEANKELSELQAVTAADIQRVASKYFAPEQRNILTVLPAAMEKTEKAKSAANADKASRSLQITARNGRVLNKQIYDKTAYGQTAYSVKPGKEAK